MFSLGSMFLFLAGMYMQQPCYSYMTASAAQVSANAAYYSQMQPSLMYVPKCRDDGAWQHPGTGTSRLTICAPTICAGFANWNGFASVMLKPAAERARESLGPSRERALDTVSLSWKISLGVWDQPNTVGRACRLGRTRIWKWGGGYFSAHSSPSANLEGRDTWHAGRSVGRWHVVLKQHIKNKEYLETAFFEPSLQSESSRNCHA